jgi:hypothetical protein
MIAGSDKQHADFVGEEAGERVVPLEGEEEDAERGEVNEGKGIDKGRAIDAMRKNSCAKESGGWGARVVLSATDPNK